MKPCTQHDQTPTDCSFTEPMHVNWQGTTVQLDQDWPQEVASHIPIFLWDGKILNWIRILSNIDQQLRCAEISVLAVIPFALSWILSPAFPETVYLDAILPPLKSISRKGEPGFRRDYAMKLAMQTVWIPRIAKSCLRFRRAELVFDIDKRNWITSSS
jgi:hypothetical protein